MTFGFVWHSSLGSGVHQSVHERELIYLCHIFPLPEHILKSFLLCFQFRRLPRTSKRSRAGTIPSSSPGGRPPTPTAALKSTRSSEGRSSTARRFASLMTSSKNQLIALLISGRGEAELGAFGPQLLGAELAFAESEVRHLGQGGHHRRLRSRLCRHQHNSGQQR